MQIFKEYFERLPERYRKENTEKLYYVLMGGYDKYQETVYSIENSRDIDKATGKTLDLIGENVGQFRIDEDDDLYRLLIKTRIIANRSNGDIPTINQVSSIALKDIFLGLKEVWTIDMLDNEPSAIMIRMTDDVKRLPTEIFNRIKSAGVRILYEVNTKIDIELGTSSKHWKYRFIHCNEVHCGVYPNPSYTYEVGYSNTLNVSNADFSATYRGVHTGEIESGGLDG